MVDRDPELNIKSPVKAESDLSVLPERDVYTKLIGAIEQDPHSDEVWGDVVRLAKAEEESGVARGGFYARVPLPELIAVGERLRAASTMKEKYQTLVQKCSTGDLWYDIILGHVNDKNLAPLAEAVSIRDGWDCGLDVGSGTGNSLRKIAPYCSTIVGLDELDFLLEASRKHKEFPQNAKLEVGNATELPSKFRREAFDLVISNGLTSYLTKEEMKKFISGLARVVKKHGSYFEPFVMKEPEELLPATEGEYLTSAKGVLTCLLDRLVSRVDKPSDMDFKEMATCFRLYGFDVIPNRPNEEGICVVQFRKMRHAPIR